MKKSLLALAVLGAFAGAASAQSSVTLFGTMDLAIERVTNKSGSGASTNDQSMSRDRRGTTQLSVKGVEDLGGGLSAIFLAEFDHDPASSSGNTVATASHVLGSAGGETYVGLSGGFGTLKLGSPNEPTLSSQSGRSPFGTKLGSGFGAVPTNVGTFGPVFGSTGHVRKNKAISYVTPNMGGLTGHIYLTGEKTARIYDLGVNYAAGPLNLWLTTLNQKASDNRLTTLMGSYDLGIARIILGFHKEKGNGSFTAGGATTSRENKGVNIAAVVPLASNIFFKANFAKLDSNNNAEDRKIMALGPEYALSKRTTLYAHYVRYTNDNATAASPTKNISDLLLGVQHNF